MSQSIHQLVSNQFAPVAASYSTSAVHSDARSLADVVALVQPKSSDVLLDVATGAGHVALAFAPLVAKVVAYDLTPAMLDQTRTAAKTRGIENLETVQGTAEELPFEDETFDLYSVRLAPHHFADVVASIEEAARVLRPGGKYVVVDTSSPEEPELDRQIDEIERLRDPSHVRNYRPSEWRAMAEAAGLEVVTLTSSFCDSGRPMDFDDWVTRMRTPAERVEILRRLFNEASPELRKVLDITIQEGKISFRLPQVNLLARKPG